MQDEIVRFVRDQLALGKGVQGIISTLKERNVDDKAIDDAFKKALSPSLEITEEKEKPEKQKKKLDATRAFTIIGILLIVAAVITVIYSEWTSVGAFGRVSFLALPMIILFGLSYYFSKNHETRDSHNWLLALGLFIFPFFFGTLLYQYKIVEGDETLFLTTSLVSLIVYLVAEYVFNKYYVAVFSLASLYVALISLLVQFDLDYIPILWLTLSVSLIVTWWGFWLTRIKSENSKPYLILGTLLVCLLLPISVLSTINDKHYLSTGLNAFITSLFGIFYLFVASYYNSLRKYFDDQTIYSLKRLLEEVAPFVLIVPYLSAGSSNSNYYVISLILSLLAILVSVRVWISTLLYLGSFGLLMSVLLLSSEVFSDSIGWPIIIFIAGFLAIGIGYAIKKISSFHKSEKEEMFLGLGKDPEVKASHLGVSKIILIILAFMFIGGPIVSMSLSYLVSRNNKPYENESFDLNKKAIENNPNPTISNPVFLSFVNLNELVFDPTLVVSEESFLASFPNKPNKIIISLENGTQGIYYITDKTEFAHNGSYISNNEVINYSQQNKIVSLDYYNSQNFSFASYIDFNDY